MGVEKKRPLVLVGGGWPLEGPGREVEHAGTGTARARQGHDASATRMSGSRLRRDSGAALDRDVNVPELPEDRLPLVQVRARVDVQAAAIAALLASREQVPDARPVAAGLREDLLHPGHAAGDQDGRIAHGRGELLGERSDQRLRVGAVERGSAEDADAGLAARGLHDPRDGLLGRLPLGHVVVGGPELEGLLPGAGGRGRRLL
mmetsp:Transcript_34355/g.91001  ORF Transcript_34355/g.91001 Transcript_34355/m.91001 type:complete len:204 (-) Transcript_34355:483-1094(-)